MSVKKGVPKGGDQNEDVRRDLAYRDRGTIRQLRAVRARRHLAVRACRRGWCRTDPYPPRLRVRWNRIHRGHDATRLKIAITPSKPEEQTMKKQQIAFAIILTYLWVMMILLGSIVLETFMVYPNIFHDPPRSLETALEFMVVRTPHDFFPPLGFLSWVTGIGPLILVWRRDPPRRRLHGRVDKLRYACTFLIAVL